MVLPLFRTLSESNVAVCNGRLDLHKIDTPTLCVQPMLRRECIYSSETHVCCTLSKEEGGFASTIWNTKLNVVFHSFMFHTSRNTSRAKQCLGRIKCRDESRSQCPMDDFITCMVRLSKHFRETPFSVMTS